MAWRANNVLSAVAVTAHDAPTSGGPAVALHGTVKGNGTSVVVARTVNDGPL
jgi:hypothetical protein